MRFLNYFEVKVELYILVTQLLVPWLRKNYEYENLNIDLVKTIKPEDSH